MRGNRGRDTKPELTIRRLLFAEGYRYRVHVKALPGCPDIAFIGRKKAIFVHGCFWHQHDNVDCPLRSCPKTNLSYWKEKLKRNKLRDATNERQLLELGWKLMVVWECETKGARKLTDDLRRFLGPPRQQID